MCEVGNPVRVHGPSKGLHTNRKLLGGVIFLCRAVQDVGSSYFAAVISMHDTKTRKISRFVFRNQDTM